MKHPEYPGGLSGEEANELICLAEHHIANGGSAARTNRVKLKKPIKFQARTKPEVREDLNWSEFRRTQWRDTLIAGAVVLVLIGLAICLTILICG